VAQAWRHTVGLPLSSNVRLHRTCVHLRFEHVLSVWQEKMLAFVGQCASRKCKVSNRGFAKHVCHESRVSVSAVFRSQGQKSNPSGLWPCSNPVQAAHFATIKAYAQAREYSPTQPARRHPAQPNPPLNGRSNGVPPSLGHRMLFAHFLWPRLGVTPLASPLALR
jgi:hypothetical protein